MVFKIKDIYAHSLAKAILYTYNCHVPRDKNFYNNLRQFHRSQFCNI